MWFDHQVKVVLMHRLAARSGRFEVEHALSRQGIFSHQVPYASKDSRMKERSARDSVKTMWMVNARILFQRVASRLLTRHRIEVARDRATSRNAVEGLLDLINFVFLKQAARNHIAAAVKGVSH
jgi:hypothetical protein